MLTVICFSTAICCNSAINLKSNPVLCLVSIPSLKGKAIESITISFIYNMYKMVLVLFNIIGYVTNYVQSIILQYNMISVGVPSNVLFKANNPHITIVVHCEHRQGEWRVTNIVKLQSNIHPKAVNLVNFLIYIEFPADGDGLGRTCQSINIYYTQVRNKSSHCLVM